MPLRPTPYDVPAHDPFASDRLERREHVIALCELVLGEPGPAVLAVNGGFGAGKSVFLQMCAAHLRNRGATVAEFNPWQQSHTGIPIVDIVASLTSQVGKETLGQRVLDDLDAAAAAMGRRLLSKLSMGLYEPGDHLPDRLRGIEDWVQTQSARDEFRDALAGAIDSAQRPLVVLVDELDRCTPQAAMDTLDTARHLFDVPGTVVILGVNQDELRHRVQTVYGGSAEPGVFLRRFIDHTVDLAAPTSMQISHVAAKALTTDSDSEDAQVPPGALAVFAVEFGLSLRDLEQLTLRVAAILTHYPAAELPVSSPRYSQARSEAIVAVCALRMAQPDLYNRFFGADADPIRAAADALADNNIQYDTVVTLCAAAMKRDTSDRQVGSAIVAAGIPRPERFQAALRDELTRLILMKMPSPLVQAIVDFAI